MAKYGVKNTGSTRPFRIWDSVAKKNVPHRCYGKPKNAMNGALLIVRWEKVGRTLEVYDIRTMRHLGTYKRRLDYIEFSGGS